MRFSRAEKYVKSVVMVRRSFGEDELMVKILVDKLSKYDFSQYTDAYAIKILLRCCLGRRVAEDEQLAGQER